MGSVQDIAPPSGAGGYGTRVARTAQDMARLLALRAECFRGDPQADDGDRFDPLCRHVLIERDGVLLAGFRVLPLASGAALDDSYAAQVYGLRGLRAYPGALLELGRFCVRPGLADPRPLRLAWMELTRIVDSLGTQMLFGCTSFTGADPARHGAALSLLAQRHVGPVRWRPDPCAPETYPLAAAGPCHDLRAATAALPPLLRSYLAMGGWVSDHAVIDRDLDTLHVFTALEVAAIPAARKRLLRSSLP